MTEQKSSEQSVRSANMAAIRSKNTSPELLVRKILFSAGFRFRLQRRDLPGRPDIVLPKHHTCIFVNGCFWHHHPGCRFATVPSTRQEYWLPKIAGNIARDARNRSELISMGWRVLVVWECACRKLSLERLEAAMHHFILNDELLQGEISGNDE